MTHTVSPREKDIKRSWHLVDVKDVVLGRVATHIATLLSGKGKPYFVRHLDCGDHVVVVNVQNVRLTGNKEQNKIYTRYSGYPGGIKRTKAAEMRKTKPEEMIRHAVHGMLPANKLRPRLMKRLYIYADGNHPYSSKFTT